MTRSLIIAPLLIATLAVGQSPDPNDSLRVYQMAPVLVESVRGKLDGPTTASAFRITASELRPFAASSLDAVLGEAAGMNVLDLGGLSGVKTVSLRGTPSGNTGIVLNGMPLNNPQNGILDLGLLPLGLFQRMEIVAGPQSADLGAASMAGTISLSTRSEDTSTPLTLGFGGGSFGLASVDVRTSGRTGDLGGSVAIGRETFDGNFPYEVANSTGVLRGDRTGAFFRREFIAADGTTKIGSGTVAMDLIGVDALRGSPGPVSSAGPQDATLRDRLGMVMLRGTMPAGESVWESGLSMMHQLETYEDRTFAPTYADRYENNVGTAWIQRGGMVGGSVRVVAGADASAASISSSWFPSGTGRRSAAVYGTVRWQSAFAGLALAGALRMDAFSDLSPRWSPKLAFGMPIPGVDGWSCRVSIAEGFRIPSFNELYWTPGGNPSLRHESGVTVEAGADGVVHCAGEHRVSATVYQIDMKDRIAGWPPENLDRASSQGMEFWWQWLPLDQFKTDVRASVCRATITGGANDGHQVPFISRQMLTARASARIASVSFIPGVIFIGRRYWTFANESAKSTGPGAIVNCTILWDRILDRVPVSLLVRGENLLDRRSVQVEGYPMPGRSVRMRLEYSMQP